MERKGFDTKSMKRIMKNVLDHYKIHMILVIICIVISSVVTVIGSRFLQVLIDGFIYPMLHTKNPDFTPLIRALIYLACIYILGVLSTYAYNRIMVNVSQGTMKNIRREVFSHMEKLPIRYFDTHSHGDIMSIYTNDIDTLRQFLGQSMPQLISAVFTVVSIIVSMFLLSLPLAVVALVVVFLNLSISSRIGGLSAKFFVKQQSSLGKINGYIEEMISGQKVIKVFTHEKENIESFVKLNNELRDTAIKANIYANILMPILAQMGNLGYVICAIIGSYLALKTNLGISVGVIVSFLTLFKSLTTPFGQISQQLNSVVMAGAGAGRIYELLDEEVENDDGYVTLVNAKQENGSLVETKERTGLWAWKHYHKEDGSYSLTELEGKMSLENVDFSYIEGKQVLFDISLYADQGEKIAFVGTTGAGKTTITNLINRFYDIQGGKIRYDGINIDKIKKSDLRKSLGIVLQDTRLFTGSIMENIRYGRLDASDEDCIRAAKLVNAHGFIERLPDGYDTIIKGEGSALSQGQRQLLAIARAAVADPPALILDEATSSIDTRTEQLVQAGMDSLMKGRTTFVIAHRLSTIKNSDCIMLLEQGRIIERGNHKELLERKGKYYRLYTGKVS